MDSPPLDLSVDEFRVLAGRVVEQAAGYLDRIDETPIRPASTGSGRRCGCSAGRRPSRASGRPRSDGLGSVAEHSRVGNGRFFGYVMGSGEPVAALADLFASVINQNGTAWRSGPATAVIERTVVSWLAEAIGCPEFGGTLTSGGSLANLMGLAMAREAVAPANETGRASGVVYASSEVHMSVGKAVGLLGLGRDNLRLLPADADCRLSAHALSAAVAADRAAGRTPLAVVACGGTIVTGAVDPIAELVAVAKQEGMWVHVDGAYGLPAAMVEPEKFLGLVDVDSMSMDAHKWLYQPLDCSVLFYRDRAAARRAFSLTDDYAASLTDDPIEGDVFFEETIELSRRIRALKLWLSLRYHGLSAFRSAVAENMRQAKLLARARRRRALPRADGRRSAERGVLPLAGRRRSDPRPAQRRDPRPRQPPRARLPLERHRPRPVRPAGLHHQPPHHRRGRRGSGRRGAGRGWRVRLMTPDDLVRTDRA